MSWGFSLLLTPLDSGGPTYTLVADAGVFALGGQAVSLARSLKLVADVGVFAFNGQTANIALEGDGPTYTLEAEVGIFAFSLEGLSVVDEVPDAVLTRRPFY